MSTPARSVSSPPYAGTVLELVDRTRVGLLHACHAGTAAERFELAHLAALRAAAAVLAAEARRTPGSRPRNVWLVLPTVAPELTEWARFFEGTAARRSAVARGSVAMSAREADDLVRAVEEFLELVLAHLGLPVGPRSASSIAPVLSGAVG